MFGLGCGKAVGLDHTHVVAHGERSSAQHARCPTSALQSLWSRVLRQLAVNARWHGPRHFVCSTASTASVSKLESVLCISGISASLALLGATLGCYSWVLLLGAAPGRDLYLGWHV